jgi:putative hydrolase of the HAD superfamily
VKAVLFDLDDTLFDHTYSTHQALNALREQYSVLQQSSNTDLFARYMELLDLIHPRALTGEFTLEEGRVERFRLLLIDYGLSSEQSALESFAAADFYRAAYQEHRREVPGSSQLLETLHEQVKIGIVTNNVTDEQISKLQHLCLSQYLDVLVTTESTAYIKPDPAIFHVALKKLGCRAEEVVMVGDAWKADVLGAHAAGIRAIWLNREGRTCPEPGRAQEIRGFEPLSETLVTLLGKAVGE